MASHSRSRTTSTSPGCPRALAARGSQPCPSGLAPVVERLLDAGALFVGKTNMDQFATGLVGTRSPYGACSSVFDRRAGERRLELRARRLRSRSGTPASRSGPTPPARAACRLHSTASWGSSRPAASSALVACVPACASIDCVSLLATSVRRRGAGVRCRGRIRRGRPLEQARAAVRRAAAATDRGPAGRARRSPMKPAALSAWEMAREQDGRALDGRGG